MYASNQRKIPSHHDMSGKIKKSKLKDKKAAKYTQHMHKRILLAEDSTEMREMITHTLHRAGYEITECANGHKLIEVLKDSHLHHQDYDLVISDVRMPGTTAIKAISELPKQDIPPVILMSAFGDDELKREANQQGVIRFFDKPFELSELRTYIDEYFDNPLAYRVENNNNNNEEDFHQAITHLPYLFMYRLSLKGDFPKEKIEQDILEASKQFTHFSAQIAHVDLHIHEVLVAEGHTAKLNYSLKVTLKNSQEPFEINNHEHYTATDKLGSEINKIFKKMRRMVEKDLEKQIK